MMKSPTLFIGLRACLKNSGAGHRPAMNGRLASENTGARRPKGRRDACPTTFSKHLLRLSAIGMHRAAASRTDGALESYLSKSALAAKIFPAAAECARP